jgi:hypothetical protein
LDAFGINQFFPIRSEAFKSYDSVRVPFIAEKMTATELTLWHMSGTDALLNLLVNGRTAKNRMPKSIEEVWFAFFEPPNPVEPGEDGFFDKMIKVRCF